MCRNILFTVLTLLSFTVFSQQNGSLFQVTDNLYFISGLGGNVSFLTTDSGVLVVDAGTIKKDGEIISQHVKSITDKPIKYLIYTHFHFDHTLGASGIADNPTIIGHINTLKNFKERGYDLFNSMYIGNLENSVRNLKIQMDSLKKINSIKLQEVESQYNLMSKQLSDAKETTIVLPDITFMDELNIILDSDTIRLIYPQSTHTDCNILVEFSNQNALATGDFFSHQVMPYIDFSANCDTENWIKQTKIFADKNYAFVIPGHGNLASSKDLIEQGNYLSDLRAKVKSLIDINKSLSEIQNSIKMDEYSSYDYKVMLPLEIEAIYNEFTNR